LYLNIKIGCSNCRYFENKSVPIPFDITDNICPKCEESDSMYIVSVNDTTKIKDLNNLDINLMNQLLKIRQL
jgi:hypothetical protein